MLTITVGKLLNVSFQSIMGRFFKNKDLLYTYLLICDNSTCCAQLIFIVSDLVVETNLKCMRRENNKPRYNNHFGVAYFCKKASIK